MKNLLCNLPAPVLLVGIGNTLKGDDAAGITLIERLREKGAIYPLVLAGEMPENHLKEIIAHAPKTVVLVDAAEMNAPAGTIKLFAASEIARTGVSTHGMSLGMLAAYLTHETKAEVYLLGIQPRQLTLGAPLSEVVDKAVKDLAEALKGEVHA